MLNGALWKSGRLLLLLALLLRLTSIPGIFVVPTLTAQLVSTNTTSTCSVPIFQAGEIKQEVDEIEYTWTLSGVTAYAQPSSLLSSLSSRVLASSSPLLTLPSSCPGSSSVSNCTFSTTVDALTYQCSGETFQGYEYTGQTVLYHAVDAPEYKEADTAAVAQNDCLSIRLPTQNDALKCCPYHASFEVSVTQEGAERNSVTLLSEPKVGDKLWSYGSEYDLQVSGDGVDGFLTDAHLWAVKDSVMRLLLGKVQVDFDQKVPSVNETRIDVTPNKDMYDARNIEKPTSVDGLLKTLPELMNNISLSLLSLTPSTTSTSCISHPYALTYVYTPLVLISAYALGLLLSLLAVLLGTKLFTLHFPAQNTFKDFVLASRNSGLDGLVDGREGTWKVREEAAKEKLRLGAMKDGRLAFGTKEELVGSRG